MFIGIVGLKKQGYADVKSLFGARKSKLFKKRFKKLEFKARVNCPTEFETHVQLASWIKKTENAAWKLIQKSRSNLACKY